MKLFAISALIEERMLWETMQFLEGKRAREIIARPHFVEQLPVVPAALNGGEAPLRTRKSDTASTVRAAIAAALAKQEEITVRGMRDITGLPRMAIDRTVFQLNRDGFLKRVSPGTYRKGRKELPA